MSHTLFEPLDASKAEIRLLQILPCENLTDKVRCCLCKVSLNDSIKFDALSWCWGDGPRNGVIEIDGEEFGCSPNLEAALRQFRERDIAKTFWIDAACINQGDLEEKSTQITLMCRIYQEAAAVRVWLGEATEGSDDAVQIIRQLLQNPVLDDCQLHDAPLKAGAIRSFCELLERPWWERVWVMQEIALAARATFHCGAASFESERLEESISKMLSGCLTGKTLFDQADKTGELTKRFLDGIRRLGPVLEMIETVRQIRTNDKPQLRAVDALVRVSALKATEPRDKVYGCLGILPGLSNLMVPDYKQALDLVYTIATITLILQIRCLYPLCYSRGRRTVDIQVEKMIFPSWCLDFARNISKQGSLFTFFSCSGEWGPFAPKFRFPFLESQAVLFDEIETCRPMAPDFDKVFGWIKSSRYLHSRWRAFFGLQLDKSEHSSYIGGGSIENAYWRTIACDMSQSLQQLGQRKRLRSAQIAAFVRWVRNPNSQGLSEEFPDWDVNKYAQDYHYSVHWATRRNNTHLFKTKKGFMGMSIGIPGVQKGDQIYFLHRGEVPWALRSVQHQSETKVFEVVCECYIHGIMDGEAFSTPPCPGSKAYKRHELRRKLFGGQPLYTDFPLPLWSNILLT